MSMPPLPLLLLLATGIGSPACSVSKGPIVVEPSALPAWVRRQLPSPMAGRNQPFNPSDVVPRNGPPRARFICAHRHADLWTVEFEQGGIGLFRRTLTLRPPRGS
ncbi:hypothetical protein [Sphingomonas sp. R1]|uniref:hypothetical protein n=1 Tax=Sphingomonas sp. R1 TaxID=399176 RepID=UPI00222478C4|nr:hypothetical protein [Sphingomonas sp. R1]UYY79159.1 hypothetical protein OIM94_09320 [Sphingomonas sp. R1]